MKNIEWLKDRVNQASLFTDDEGSAFGDSWVVSRNVVIGLIDQLDEPEVLSQEWIDEHSNGASRSQYVWVDDLKELLVPKQVEITEEQALRKIVEKYPLTPNDIPWILDRYVANVLVEQPKKPVIPDYVAEWIDTNKEKYDLVQLFWEIGEGGLVNLDVDRWIEENPNTFARAWLNGYKVEEKKYYARAKLSSLPNFENNGENFFNTLSDFSTNDIWLDTKNSAITMTKEDWAKLYVNENNALFIEKNNVVEENIR